ncbi:MAG: hypothetical protein LJE97_09020 [Betaproteobacteria bacterium]|jgi:uncharacterized membrane protein|nr:hypothetical protein [Betaproteobacteria bacterium]
MSAQLDQTPTTSQPSESLVNVAHLVYALHTWSVIAGIIGAASIVGMFLTGWPSIIAVIINYVKRPDARGTWLDTHFGWQIRTFWYTLLWVVIAVIAAFTVIGLPFAIGIAIVITIWVVYRIVRGWIALASAKPMPV